VVDPSRDNATGRRAKFQSNFYSPAVATRTSLGFEACGPCSADHERPAKTVIAMTKTQSVLIVDDEPNILLSLQFLMKKTGYDVRTARDGEEAWAEISRAAPDLVLLDVMMPKIDGFSICERIRANPAWKDMRIIMLTARGRDVEREKGLALGADDYITKPFSTKDAIARVEAVLARPKADGR
jgi:two-component system alkaline phosphatase synthesis response regulator PhoP